MVFPGADMCKCLYRAPDVGTATVRESKRDVRNDVRCNQRYKRQLEGRARAVKMGDKKWSKIPKTATRMRTIWDQKVHSEANDRGVRLKCAVCRGLSDPQARCCPSPLPLHCLPPLLIADHSLLGGPSATLPPKQPLLLDCLQ